MNQLFNQNHVITFMDSVLRNSYIDISFKQTHHKYAMNNAEWSKIGYFT